MSKSCCAVVINHYIPIVPNDGFIAGTKESSEIVIPAEQLSNSMDHSVIKSGVPISIQLGKCSQIKKSRENSRIIKYPKLISGQSRDTNLKCNIQVNDGSLDYAEPIANSFIEYGFTEAGASMAVARGGPQKGNNIVIAYNSTSIITDQFGTSTFTQVSASLDKGKTWSQTAIFGSPELIFGIGNAIVASDDQGNFYLTQLAASNLNVFGITFQKSIDGGLTWSSAITIVMGPGIDRQWLTVGHSSLNPAQTNLYVTYVDFNPDGTNKLVLVRSLDGGLTWLPPQIIFTPTSNPDPSFPQANLQFPNPVVDEQSGYLYVPFVRMSFTNTDFYQILVSTDDGESFNLLNFNVPGAPDITLLPFSQPGHIIDCGNSGGIRYGIHQGPAGPGRSGLPSFVYCSRITSQPAFAVNGHSLYLAYAQNIGPGDAANLDSRDALFLIRSSNGGQNWHGPSLIVGGELHYAEPRITLRSNSVYVTYYVQHDDETLDWNMWGLNLKCLETHIKTVSNSSFNLPPTVIPLAPPFGNSFPTINYDVFVAPGFGLGDHQSLDSIDCNVYTAWTDCRNTLTELDSPKSPLPGVTHPQQDIFYQLIKL